MKIHRLLCQNKDKVSLKFDDTISAKLFEVSSFFLHLLACFHKLTLWNCMTSIFFNGLTWRSAGDAIFHIQLIYKFQQ